MSFINKLMDGAAADVAVLRSLDSKGDDFGKFRDVDFLFHCPSKEKAELVASFINDHHFGRAKIVEAAGKHDLFVAINMPVQQNIIGPVAGFMVCLAELFGLDFDGWGCVAQRG